MAHNKTQREKKTRTGKGRTGRGNGRGVRKSGDNEWSGKGSIREGAHRAAAGRGQGAPGHEREGAEGPWENTRGGEGVGLGLGH